LKVAVDIAASGKTSPNLVALFDHSRPVRHGPPKGFGFHAKNMSCDKFQREPFAPQILQCVLRKVRRDIVAPIGPPNPGFAELAKAVSLSTPAPPEPPSRGQCR
jgi:hypothetical protein